VTFFSDVIVMTS